ncbi:MAG: hypothetical protein A4E56_00440 [Pelotomaculum sp. PtaU1.Bin065]|nr:MAG: hypothetical protein A4E56_00440 [Pelotomaculum sp. PtaU1.Bin065]
MPKSRSNRAAAAIGRASASGGGLAEFPEDLRDLTDDELAEALREWEESLNLIDSEDIRRQRQEVAQLLTEYRRNRGDG